MIKIYVGGSSREMDRVLAAVALVDAHPNTSITYRWFDDMRRDIEAGKKESDLTREEAQAAGTKCLEGVWNADVVWMLYPNEPTRGAWGEIAAAITANELTHSHSPLVVSFDRGEPADPGKGSQIFSRLADQEIFGDAEAFRWILEQGAA